MSFGIGAGPSGRRPPTDFPPPSAVPPSSPIPPFQPPQSLLPSFGVSEAQGQALSSPVNFGVTSQLKRSRSTSPINYAGVSQSKRTRSPDENFSENLTRSSLGLDDRRGRIASSLASSSPIFYDNAAATTQTNQGEIPLSLKRASDMEKAPQGNIFNDNIPKNVMTMTQRREKLPGSLSSHLSPQSNKNHAVDDSEREALAKAKRLARFSKELTEPVLRKENLTVKRPGVVTYEQKISIGSLKEDTVNGNACDGKEDIKPSNVVVGLCPDMCPESEREERERKGDLDKYERVDGDRNQTTKHLAVKKYNRMAEREPILIRPMPVLKMTINYLFGLLDRPYSGNFLGLYNFMWDRLRAIRMDLRMQHLFDQQAITMLEQMIRLHVIAMHELCEQAKGEGFSDGFDAHLNIEQMNKASSDLFQMYDDHVKKDIFVPTEREFRGYYALLKLDKHPGYKVEPAQLSLDLAKMSSYVRGSTEVLFARQVARACRTGNFVAFFRLAKNASYLQACLMHAHFAKLRSQALASLHSGLQSNQGIPVSQIVNWLAMEGEDIKSLLEFHGFAIRMYDVPYMVKEGQFLNSDKEFPNKSSHLVHSKKSERIIDDVIHCNIRSMPTSHSNELKVHSCNQIIATNIVDKSIINDVDVEMHYSDEIVCREEPKVSLAPDASSRPIVQHGKADTLTAQAMPIRVLPAEVFSSSRNRLFTDTYKDKSLPESEKISFPPYNSLPEISKVFSSPIDEPLQTLGKPGKGMGMELSAPISQPKTYEQSPVASANEWTAVAEVKTLEVVPVEENEIPKAKLKLMIRIWRRRSKKQKEMREQRQLAAVAAFNRIPAGPPLFPHTPVRMECVSELNFDRLKKEMFQRQQKASAKLNVSDVVGEMLSASNLKSRCFCWKLLVCSPSKDTHAGRWLHSKLLASPMKDDEELMYSSSDLAIWKKWFLNPEEYCYSCCLSIVRKFCFNDQNVADLKVLAGASSLLFVVSENLSTELQKVQLHRLVQSLPLGSGIPLLILVCGLPEGMNCSYESITANLALHDVEKNRIKRFCIVPLLLYSQQGKSIMFVDDDPLRNGLEWLASESAPQPLLRQVQLRELIRRSLRFLTKKLDNLDHVSPNQCVDMFNEAVDRSVEEIKTAAKSNYFVWPCPEVDLLEAGSVERSYVDLYLPSIDWSSDSNIDKVVGKLVACKLPSFPDDIPSPNQGSGVMAEDLENQKVALQSRLIWYLTAATKLFPNDMAGREADIILQNGCFLRLNGSKFTITPRWATIFRRISNWRLEELAGKGLEAYVLEDTGPSEEDLCSYSELFSNFDQGVDVLLDEMLSVACGLSHPHNNGNYLISEGDTRKYQETDANEIPVEKWHSGNEVSLSVNVRNDNANGTRASDWTSERRASPNVDFRKDQEVDIHVTTANDSHSYNRISSNVNSSDVTVMTGINQELQSLLDGGLFSGPEGEKLWIAMNGAAVAQNRVAEMLSYYGY